MFIMNKKTNFIFIIFNYKLLNFSFIIRIQRNKKFKYLTCLLGELRLNEDVIAFSIDSKTILPT